MIIIIITGPIAGDFAALVHDAFALLSRTSSCVRITLVRSAAVRARARTEDFLEDPKRVLEHREHTLDQRKLRFS